MSIKGGGWQGVGCRADCGCLANAMSCGQVRLDERSIYRSNACRYSQLFHNCFHWNFNIHMYMYVNFLSNFANWSIKVGAAYANKLRIRYVVQVLEGVRETDTR